MASKPVKFFREVVKILPRLRALEERYSDTQTELKQFISLLSIKNEVPAIPPKHLQIRIAGAYNAGFFSSGRSMFNDIEDFLKSNGESFFKFNNILDFGCGCGRFLIPMSFLVPPAKISGTDIDEEPIRWLKNHYPAFKDLDMNGIKPPTKYANGTFDFIYGISVFTHLPEEMQHAWLEEMSRIIKPGGFGLFTTHGEKHYTKLPEPARQELAGRGFYYSVGELTKGLPEFYQTSYQTHDYIKREWAKYFEVVAIRKEGIGKNQDAVLVRKRS
jgi:2-polyprenyl-3-methyl-5-hydroxy-6-metoxy-1,4-benzoquinol methylase